MSTAETNPDILIQNTGPIGQLAITLPEGGGVTVLKGRNDHGKSEALKAVGSLLNGEGKLEPKDGEITGLVKGLGVTIVVGSQTRRKGELEVLDLEGRFDVGEFVTGGNIADPEAADARRVKCVLRMMGVLPDPSLFYGLAASREEFEAVVSGKSLRSDDLVIMARNIKKDFDEEALKLERLASQVEGKIQETQNLISAEDVTLPHDEKQLGDALEAAISHKAGVTAQADLAKERLAATAEAKAKLAEVGEDAGVEQAEAAVRVANEKLTQRQELLAGCNAKVEEIKAQLAAAEAAARAAKDELRLAEVDAGGAGRALEAAQQKQKLISGWKATIAKAETNTGPTAEQLAGAEKAVADAREHVVRGARIRSALEAKNRLAELQREVEAITLRSKRLRTAGRGTDGVLSQCVDKAGAGIRMKDGRMVVAEHPRGEDTKFSALSVGARWKIGTKIAIQAVGKGGIFVIPQEAWEGLDPINRREVAALVAAAGVNVITAEPSEDDEVVAQTFTG